MRDPALRENRRAELQVGALVAAAAALLVAGIFWISGADFGRDYTVYGIGPQASQLTSGANVYLSGVEVGSVSEVHLQDDLSVRVRMNLDLERPLPRTTTGVVKSAGFIGAMMVELRPGGGPDRLVAGDTIPLRTQTGLQDLAAEVGQDAAVVLDRVREVLSDSVIRGVRTATTSAAEAAQELESLLETQRGAVDALLADLNRVSGELARLTEGRELERTVSRMDTLSARLVDASAGLDTISENLATITGRLERGEGTLGRMLTEDELYTRLMATLENLQTTTEEVGLLAQDLRTQPDRYLRELDFSVF